jgi:hypothetical protein
VAALDAWRISSNQKLELEHKLQDLRGQVRVTEVCLKAGRWVIFVVAKE